MQGVRQKECGLPYCSWCFLDALQNMHNLVMFMERHSGLCLTTKTCASLMQNPHKSEVIKVAVFLSNISQSEVCERALCDTPRWVWHTGEVSELQLSNCASTYHLCNKRDGLNMAIYPCSTIQDRGLEILAKWPYLSFFHMGNKTD